MRVVKKLLFLGFLFTFNVLHAQEDPTQSIFNNVFLQVDTNTFNWNTNYTYTNGTRQMVFSYQDPKAVAQFDLLLKPEAQYKSVHIIPSADYTAVDSVLTLYNKISFRLKFTNLSNSKFLRVALRVQYDSSYSETVLIPLFAHTTTYTKLYVKNPELYIGEETVLELTTNHPDNIVIDNTWTEDLPINYRLTKNGDRVLLHLLPTSTGKQILSIPIHLNTPFFKEGRFIYQLDPLQHNFNVKSGRLAFLATDHHEITLTPGSTEAIEIQLDDHRLLEMGKTYRIENQEEAGGALIAEIFTKNNLNNNKILCLLRPYAYHRKADGYLYVKDGDRARFITNFDITPKTNIQSISIQREGEDWKVTNTVYPGEIVNIKLEGEGLHKGSFRFVGASQLVGDTLVRNENIAFFKLQIPIDINSKSIDIFNNNRSTGKGLKVSEYQRPKRFDFIDLRMGLKSYQLNEIDVPIYYEDNLSDIVLHFDPKKLDRPGALHGKQYLTIKIKISDKKGTLLELYEFEDVIICPADNSARYKSYDQKNCRIDDIALNNYIRRKTYNLPEWSTVEIEVKHQDEKYGGKGFSKKVKVVLKRKMNFDIDVSFPAGLLILKSQQEDFTNFSGISFAMIAQMSFYHPKRLGEYRPFKFGAGFIAIDAFNFTENNDNRDLALVMLGSLYPTSSENKLSFPLYLGYGYLLQEKKGFFLIGPGIRVRF